MKRTQRDFAVILFEINTVF